MEGKMFKYVQAKQFVDYLLEHYPNDPLLDTFENDNVKIIQDADKYLLVFVDYDKQVRAQSHYQSKINKLFSLVLNGNIVVEIIWDKTGIYDTDDDKKQREIKRLAIEKESKEEHIRQMNYLFGESRIPEIKRNVFTFENYKVPAENVKAFEIIKNYKTGFLTMCGGLGVGKTHLACAIGQKFMESEDDVIYYQAEELFDMLRHTYDKDGDDYNTKMNELKECQLLIIDDFGTQKNTDWVLSKLDTLIDSRYINEKSTILTTNLTIKAISDISGRIASRLSSGIILTLIGEDYRASHKTQIDKLPPQKENNKFTQGKYGHLVQR